jgi:hypothetical protein
MSWRRLLVLIGGLSPASRWALSHRDREEIVDDPDVAERHVASLLGV